MTASLQLAMYKEQCSMNDQLSMINDRNHAQHVPSLKTENCEFKIAISEGVA